MRWWIMSHDSRIILPLISLAEDGHTIAPINPWKFHRDWSSHLWVYKQCPTGFDIFWAPDNHTPRFARGLIISPCLWTDRSLKDFKFGESPLEPCLRGRKCRQLECDTNPARNITRVASAPDTFVNHVVRSLPSRKRALLSYLQAGKLILQVVSSSFITNCLAVTQRGPFLKTLLVKSKIKVEETLGQPDGMV